MTYTHKGWFGFCPVYYSRPESEAPGVIARHWGFAALLSMSEWLFGLYFTVRQFVNIDYEPQWPMLITGELNPPLRCHEDAVE